jgi:hypothetical protein
MVPGLAMLNFRKLFQLNIIPNYQLFSFSTILQGVQGAGEIAQGREYCFPHRCGPGKGVGRLFKELGGRY